MQLADVKIDGLDRVDETYVRAKLDLDSGSIVDQRLLSDRIDEVYALDEFDRVQYELDGNPDRPELAITAFEKPWGPNFVRFDVGLQVNSDGSTAFVLGGDLVRGGLNAFGGELHGVLAIGRTSTAELSLYQPFERRRRYFVEPGIRLRRSVEDFFDGEDPVARYQLSEALGALELGRVFGNVAELRMGLVSGTRTAERDIAPPILSVRTPSTTAAGPLQQPTTAATASRCRRVAGSVACGTSMLTSGSAATPSRITNGSKVSCRTRWRSGTTCSCSRSWVEHPLATRCRPTTSSCSAGRTAFPD